MEIDESEKTTVPNAYADSTTLTKAEYRELMLTLEDILEPDRLEFSPRRVYSLEFGRKNLLVLQLRKATTRIAACIYMSGPKLHGGVIRLVC